MIFFRNSLRRGNKSGIILIVVLWILLILSVLAITLGHQTGVEVQLTKFALAKVKSRHIAASGIFYAFQELTRDSRDEQGSTVDTKYECGFSLQDAENPEEIFRDIAVGDGRFSITYTAPDDGGGGGLRYGFTDEESRLNLNAIGPGDIGVLKELILLGGVDEDTATQIASSVVDWRDEDSEPMGPLYGAEENYYASLDAPYHCKNGSFENLKELLLVRGVTPEIFEGLKPSLTVFPRQGVLRINFNTASPRVLTALAHHYAGARTNTELGDADSLIEKILVFRRGEDGLEATEDDRPVRFQEMPLNAKERVIALTMQRNQTLTSNHLRVHVKGVEAESGIATDVDAVISREDLSIIYWQSR